MWQVPVPYCSVKYASVSRHFSKILRLSYKWNIIMYHIVRCVIYVDFDIKCLMLFRIIQLIGMTNRFHFNINHATRPCMHGNRHYANATLHSYCNAWKKNRCISRQKLYVQCDRFGIQSNKINYESAKGRPNSIKCLTQLVDWDTLLNSNHILYDKLAKSFCFSEWTRLLSTMLQWIATPDFAACMLCQ